MHNKQCIIKRTILCACKLHAVYCTIALIALSVSPTGGPSPRVASAAFTIDGFSKREARFASNADCEKNPLALFTAADFRPGNAKARRSSTSLCPRVPRRDIAYVGFN